MAVHLIRPLRYFFRIRSPVPIIFNRCFAAKGFSFPSRSSSTPEIETVTLAHLGPTSTEAIVEKWLVAPGAYVNAGDSLCTVQTDKATVDVESPHTGVVQSLLAKAGDTVPVGGGLVSILKTTTTPLATKSRAESQTWSKSGEKAPVERKRVFRSLSEERLSEPTVSVKVITDVSKSIPKSRKFDLLLLKEGQQAVVWDSNGEGRIEKGPKKVILSGDSYDLCSHYTAGSSEYLQIEMLDGRTEHIPGPCEIFFNPMEHRRILKHPAVMLNSNEALVVYQPDEHGVVERRIIYGPNIHFPTSLEWFHNFEWHGGRQKYRFQKLRTLPDHIAITINDVRTADDALISLNIAIFFKLIDINMFLQSTRDPLLDFESTATADVIRYTSAIEFEYLKQGSEDLGKLETYHFLMSRAKQIGFEVSKVVFRGFSATSNLKTTHELALTKRTELVLRTERTDQEQAALDAKQDHYHSQTKQRLEMKTAEVHHDLKLRQMRHENKLSEMRRMHEENLKQTKETHDADITYLKQLSSMRVNINDFLISQIKSSKKSSSNST